MYTHSMFDRAGARSFVIVQDVRGLRPAMWPPLAARPEGRYADLPQECSSIIAQNFPIGNSNTETGNRPPTAHKPPGRGKPDSSPLWCNELLTDAENIMAPMEFCKRRRAESDGCRALPLERRLFFRLTSRKRLA